MAKKALLDVIVSKKRWCRGLGCVRSALLCETSGKMCCIGFMARACGLKPKNIRGMAGLEDLPADAQNKSPLIKTAVENKEEHLTDAYMINDSEALTDKERIKALKPIGRKLGVNFTFAD